MNHEAETETETETGTVRATGGCRAGSATMQHSEKTRLFPAAACRVKTGEHGAAALSKARTRHVSVGEADQRRLPEMFIRLFLRAGGRINTTIGGGVVPTQVRREKGLQTETSKDQNRLDFVDYVYTSATSNVCPSVSKTAEIVM